MKKPLFLLPRNNAEMRLKKWRKNDEGGLFVEQKIWKLKGE